MLCVYHDTYNKFLALKTAGEEELQLQLALAMSREEHEQVCYEMNYNKQF